MLSESTSYGYLDAGLALLRFIDPFDRSFDPNKFDKNGIGSIITLIAIAHHIHLSKFVENPHFFDPMISDLSANPEKEDADAKDGNAANAAQGMR